MADATDLGEMVASAGTLAGEYRVAGAGGDPIDLPYGITASITPDRILVTADCVKAEWAYHFEGALFATERVPTESCERALAPEEETLFAAFDGADRVEHMESGAYEFTGTGPSATLFTQ